ncbi:hypothetical protein MLD38_026543 [Melastoma candidum]|uniref:Uncharacterized protein n=1 Tax=Melastoma candidum TaxID=119954 RepID=A0ACB9P0H4_9MYRT|nr:hypothetical protein MLD38_026543 [Melastoma candidum]
MVKMGNLGPLSGTCGQVRTNCRKPKRIITDRQTALLHLHLRLFRLSFSGRKPQRLPAMDLRLGLLLFLLSFGFMGTLRARQAPQNLRAFDYQKLDNEIDLEDLRNDKLCLMCEEYAEVALDYLANNKTQTEIIEVLHVSCSQLGALKKECIKWVDNYVPMFFLEISSIEPDAFCQKVGVCKPAPTFSMVKENRCELCEDTVSDVLTRLRNPDTQMDIMHTLLKACDSMETYAAKCKKTVLEYAPLLFANTAQFLEKHDVCVAVHACDSPIASLGKPLLDTEVPAFSDS